MSLSEGGCSIPEFLKCNVSKSVKIVSNMTCKHHQLQGQLAGFVVDEAHCVRYLLCHPYFTLESFKRQNVMLRKLNFSQVGSQCEPYRIKCWCLGLRSGKLCA